MVVSMHCPALMQAMLVPEPRWHAMMLRVERGLPNICAARLQASGRGGGGGGQKMMHRQQQKPNPASSSQPQSLCPSLLQCLVHFIESLPNQRFPQRDAGTLSLHCLLKHPGHQGGVCGGVALTGVAGAVEPVAADAVLLCEVLGEGVRVGLGRDRHVEGGVKDGHLDG